VTSGFRKNKKGAALTKSEKTMENKKLHHFSHGQSLAEYVIIIATVSAALFIGMQIYVQRGIQAAIRVAADQAGRQQDSLEDADTGANVSGGDTSSSSGTTRMRTLLGGSLTTDTDEATGSDAQWTTVAK
jgi:hypothetical protein